jgi:hypothetical protein
VRAALCVIADLLTEKDMRSKLLILAGLWLVSLISFSTNATEIYPVNGKWYFFDVDEAVSQSGGVEWIDAQGDELLGYVGDGSALSFSFLLTTSALLNVVDAGFSGDIFTLLVNGNHYTSSFVKADSNTFAGADFVAAWAATEFSRASILLVPGHYTVSGFLNQSAIDEYGLAYMASVGGLQIIEVSEPGVFALALIGLALLILRRRYRIIVNSSFDKGARV